MKKLRPVRIVWEDSGQVCTRWTKREKALQIAQKIFKRNIVTVGLLLKRHKKYFVVALSADGGSRPMVDNSIFIPAASVRKWRFLK